ncbi:hypothetical protein FG379_000873 [Cryptosporidium bovis]|uniref:uncharacterized protein n=1 Tax=Cryptosporidium bovis TaxID=310047 RepID=UPI00351A7B01|nr:hypothetical protein FG379_000873 [Cryptosporidium bovis]
MCKNNALRAIIFVIFSLVLFFGFNNKNCACSSPEESEFSEKYIKKFSLLLYTIFLEVTSECQLRSFDPSSTDLAVFEEVGLSLSNNFDECEKVLIDRFPVLSVPYIPNSKIPVSCSIAYEICCRIRKSISTHADFSKIINGSSKYMDKEDYVRTSMETISTFKDLEDKSVSSYGFVYSSTLDPHRGITSSKDTIREIRYEADSDNLKSSESQSSDEDEDKSDDRSSYGNKDIAQQHIAPLTRFDVKLAPFMHCNSHQYIYTYYNKHDSSKCLGLSIPQLEVVSSIQSVSINVKGVPRIPLDIACTAMWFISQRWDYCPLVFRELAQLKMKPSIKFCEIIERNVPEKSKYLTRSLLLSDSYMILRASKILEYVETVLKLNSRHFPEFEITSRDIASIIYQGESDTLINNDEKEIYNSLTKNRLEKKDENFNDKEIEYRNKKFGITYPAYKRNRDNFTTIFDQIMYNGDEYYVEERDNLLILPLELKRSPDWTSEKHFGSYSKEILNSRTVLQNYYIPPPSTFVPNDVSNWITGPCCWLKNNQKHIPPLFVSISKDHGYNLHILNACEGVFALINDSGESCANVIVSAIFFSYSLESYAMASDICSEVAIRANLPFYPKKSLKDTLFSTNQRSLIALYEGIVVALCLELGIILEKENIHKIIFSDYPVNSSLIPRMSINNLLYRALKLPNDLGKVSFWKWEIRMYSKLSNKQARIILSQRTTQLTLEIAQATNEIEIMNDILRKKNILQGGNSKNIDLSSNELNNKIKNNYLHHYNYDYKLANTDHIEMNVKKLEKLRYDLISEKERIEFYIQALTNYIGHKIHDVPKEYRKEKFTPLYKPSVFKINIYDSTRLKQGIDISRSVRSLHQMSDYNPINKKFDQHSPKVEYKIKRYYREIGECAFLTDRGLEMAVYTQELFGSYLNIPLDISIACLIIHKMPPYSNIKESFIRSAFSVLHSQKILIDFDNLEFIWLKIVPIFSVPSGKLSKTKYYKLFEDPDDNFENSQDEEYNGFRKANFRAKRNEPIILDDKTPSSETFKEESDVFSRNGCYRVPEPKKVSNLVKVPKKNDYLSPIESNYNNIHDFDNFWNKINSLGHETSFNSKLINDEYKALKGKIVTINSELTQAYKNLNTSKSEDRDRYYTTIINILEKDKKKVFSRILYLAGIIATQEVKNSEKDGYLIPNNVRKIADLHKVNSICEADILKLKSDDSNIDHDRRIKELEYKISENNIEMMKIIEIEGNDLEDPRWYSDIEKCLSSYIPFRTEVESVYPSMGFQNFYLTSKVVFKIDQKEKCSSTELRVYAQISRDLKKLFNAINIPVVKIQGKRLEFMDNSEQIDPRKMIYWQYLHGMLLGDKKEGCKYLKKFLKIITPIKGLKTRDFIGSPMFIIWCANHIQSRLGNEDIWRNIIGLIWLIFNSKPFKPKDYIWKNITLV